ncbi:unnamed protein product [Didymodactylos carnosus]|uniref:Glucose-methanol-choline oxidoreductase C-terminal domain-containing protein n=1 Tax=Didymodactylos carnosus TaxID=1234261 RepID=A0A814L6N6_9BILA|nr:unnamed protein product [Didymodactylos carnosus]CAF1060953.1 unnamed protein product [Didymodactylos carnosus]CAF3511266.1 unnamed protein product [Didymodactylos carnosus]CAF3829268.1 unnamed protein product [Didymodactylos carnosus]
MVRITILILVLLNQSPDTQIHFCPLTADENLFKNFNYKPKIYQQHLKKYMKIYPQTGGQYWLTVCIPTLLYPKSHGGITLASNDPFQHPLIDPKYLTEHEDVERLVSGCKLVEKIYPSLICEMNEIDVEIDQNERWESYIRKFSITIYHPVGTYKMGREQDSTTVVTPDTRVKGVQGLRVVDASILPKIVSGNTNILLIAMAECAADLIKNGSKQL